MTPRMQENLMKALFVLVIFTVLLLQSLFTQAGASPRVSKLLETKCKARHETLNSHRNNVFADSATTTAYKGPCFHGKPMTNIGSGFRTATITTINGLP